MVPKRMREGQSQLSRTMDLLRASPLEFARVAIGKARKISPEPTGRRVGRIGKIEYPFDFSHGVTSMLYRRTYQPEIAVAMRRHLRKGSTFVDVGANLGYFTALGAELVGPTGHVFAFEPVPTLANTLRHLASLNPGYDIRVHQIAVGERMDEVDLFVNEGENVGMNSLLRNAVPSPSAPMRVQMQRLDRVLAGPIDLVKIDVEGFELSVLRSLTGLIDEHRPAVICELDPRRGASIVEAEAWAAEHGYFPRDVLDRRPLDLASVSALRDVLFESIAATGSSR